MSTIVTDARGRLARTLALADAGVRWLAASADDEPPPDGPAPSLRGPAWAGVVGTLLISLSATHRGRYFPVQRPSEWPVHIPFLSSRGTTPHLVATAVFGIGTLLVLGAWLTVVRRARAG